MNKFEENEKQLVRELRALAYRAVSDYAQEDDLLTGILASLTLACEREAHCQGIELVITYKGGSDEN